jgi:large subunit ribosomal protein L28
MARFCRITNKKPMAANHVSHAHNKTNRWQKPNIQVKKIYDPELGREVRVKVSTRALRTITKLGLSAYLRKLAKKGQVLTLKDLQ